VGSITDWHAVESACTGVTSVIHVAGLISFGTFPDNSRMEKVNIAGMKIHIQRDLQFTVVATKLRIYLLVKRIVNMIQLVEQVRCVPRGMMKTSTQPI
jgi:hypothetical protein